MSWEKMIRKTSKISIFYWTNPNQSIVSLKTGKLYHTIWLYTILNDTIPYYINTILYLKTGTHWMPCIKIKIKLFVLVLSEENIKLIE